MSQDPTPTEKTTPPTIIVTGQNYPIDKHFDSEYEKRESIIALVKEVWGISEKFTGELVLQFYVGGLAGVKKTQIFK
jgi:hypothetical protein